VINAGTSVGSAKFTWYVRFHGRTRNQALQSQRGFLSAEYAKAVPQEAAESMLSYADLQA